MRIALALSGSSQINWRTNRTTKIMGTVVNKESSSEEMNTLLIKRTVYKHPKCLISTAFKKTNVI